MALTPGSRLGPSEILSALGAGGMGEVFRARDTRLNREVAIKVLPDSFASDANRVARFTREAQTLAALNHPNIASIHGLEHAGDVRALVMELVEGEDLSQRLTRGAIPLDEALPIARQIAEALEAAHEQGIIHRDLKPANIKVRSDGTVKVLDFGLAKLTEAPGAGLHAPGELSHSPTITSPAMTQAGVILGTAAYMSPEQAKGRPADKRSDVWAFGCVLYEMLTGTRAFDGEDMTDVLGAVVRLEPNWKALPSDVPPLVRTLLHNCLVKDRRRRVADISTARFVLDQAAIIATDPVAAPTTTPLRSATPRSSLFWIMASAAVLAVLAMAWPTWRHWQETPALVPPETRADIVTPVTDDPTSFALSPDGRQITFVASGEGASRLWLRSLAGTSAQVLAGTEGATLPFWSPDGRSIAFFTNTALKRLDVSLGSVGLPQTLAPVTGAVGGTWNTDGVIVFAPSRTSPLMRVSATGGAAKAVTTISSEVVGHRWPKFLPDGRRFLFRAAGTPEATATYVGALDGTTPTKLTGVDGPAEYLRSGWLLWARAATSTLMAQRLDVETGALMGPPVTVADGVTFTPTGHHAYSVAPTGLIAYRATGATRRQLVWFDRSGNPRGTLGWADDGGLASPELSPDDNQALVMRTVQGNADVWLVDNTRSSRLTFDAAADTFPVWSPDGGQVAFDSNRTGHRQLYRKRTDGVGSEELLVESEQDKGVMSWSSDGKFLLYRSQDPTTRSDLWAMPLSGERKPFVFLRTGFDERTATFSPDGKWVAYQSDASEPLEVWVRPFPPSNAQWQISTEGGIEPRWRRDGKELYYIAPDGTLMAAAIAVQGDVIRRGAPGPLFKTRIWGGGTTPNTKQQYDVARDGRFLINTELDSPVAPITLLMNWNPEAKK